MPVSTLPELLDRRSQEADSRLVFEEGVFSYAELDQAARRTASGLRELGIGEGDRVAIWLENGFPWLSMLFACARLSAIAVAINSRFKSAEVSDIIERSGAKALLVSGAKQEWFDILADCPTLAGLKTVVTAWGSPDSIPDRLKSLDFVAYEALAAKPPLEESFTSADAGCIVFTTSGTTSKPKFVLHDQRRVIRHGLDVARFSGLDASGVMFQAPPFCGTFGFSATFAALSVGAGLVVPMRWDAAAALKLVNGHKVTHMMATDDAVSQLLGASDEPVPVPTVRYVGLAGVNPKLEGIYEQADARGLRLAGMYGSSEVQAIVSLQEADASREDRAMRGGRLVSANARVRACDPETGRALAHGEPGELEFKVPDSGMIEYLFNPDATARAFRPDGYFRSGDLGYTLADGRFVFLSRMGDSLRLGGFLVDPREIEDVIQGFEGIRQAQVVAIETDRGNRPVAFVIMDEGAGLDEDAAKEFTARKLARFKVPVAFHVVDDYPKTVSANATKIQKAKLREMAQARAQERA